MSLFSRAAGVLNAQKAVISAKNEEIAVLQKMILIHQRSLLELAIAFRVALESPEIDIRDDIDSMIQELSYGVAQTEEHVV